MTKIELYNKYLAELEQNHGEPLSTLEGHTAEEIVGIYENNWQCIYKDDQEIGFLVADDEWIFEAYVLPEYRNQGYMRRAVGNHVKNKQYKLKILKDSYAGKKLKIWNQIFEKFGYELVDGEQDDRGILEFTYKQIQREEKNKKRPKYLLVFQTLVLLLLLGFMVWAMVNPGMSSGRILAIASIPACIILAILFVES